MEQKPRQLTGLVVSSKMQKTAVVLVERTKRHSRYLKLYQARRKFKCHDEKNQARVGDSVVIEETRPMSREKRWKIIKIMDSQQQPTVDQIEKNP